MRAGHRLGLLRRGRPAELFVLPELRKKGCDRMIRRDREPTLLGLGLLVGIVVVAEIAAGLCAISACREVARIVAAALG